jgi:hypothetical protein
LARFLSTPLAAFYGVLAAAVTSAILINLLAMAGLPQIVGRMPVLDANRLVALLASALALPRAVPASPPGPHTA